MSVQYASHYRFTVDQYQRLAGEGFIDLDARVELIEGEIVDMTPIGSRHNAVVDRLARACFTKVPAEQGIIRIQGSLRLNDFVSPQPDLVLLKPQPQEYENALPDASVVLLVIEVADSSLVYDQSTKALQYAQNGIGEYWLFNLIGNQVVVHRSPTVSGYREKTVRWRDDVLTSLAFPELSISVTDILG